MTKFAWVLLALVGAGVVVGSWALLKMPEGDSVREGDVKISNPEPSSGKQTYHLEVDGLKREFVVYRPEDLGENEEVPVVFMFHGSGGSGPKMYQETGWKDKADEEGFMVVYPTGLKYHVYSEEKVIQGEVRSDVSQYQTKWNSYELPGLLDGDYPDQTVADDVKFTQELVTFIEDNYAVDEERYYVTGFSNGGQFAVRLAVEMSDVFAAFAPTSAGVVHDQILAAIDDSGESVTPRPIIQLIGANDAKLVHGAGVEEFATDETAAEDGNAVKDTYISNFLALEGLADEYTYENVFNAAHFTYDQSLTGADNEYQIVVVDNMGHIYPDDDTFRFDVTDIYWPFFEQYTL